MSTDKQARLRPWLVKAYHAATTAAEFNLVVTLWMACGLENPVHGE